ncbi:MAG: hypothetical protein VX460_03345 [Planctomycetota bacterium]|nr:hypothetical protein [Planctomycetota bacterium]
MKTLLAHAALLALVTSCGGETKSAAPVASAGPHPLDGYYLDAAPAGAIEVAALRGLEDGATVTVRGDVQEFAPVSGKAVLSLYDHALLSCDEIEGDQCPTPWDFCCIPPEDIAKACALVEFREGGKLMSAELGGFHGITHLSDVVITGTLSLDDKGNAKIIADGLHVE